MIPMDRQATHLEMGCYRGQETVARVHTLGRRPRRLTLLHLDGTENRLLRQGADLVLDGRASASWAAPPGTTSSARSRSGWSSATCRAATLDADGLPAQGVVVDPEVGLHVRPNLR
jgi:folate-binding Fe-S cluster repair protein YgfZ